MSESKLPELRLMHEMGVDDGHFFRKKDGIWVCACGVTKNRYGQPLRVVQ